jgi:hypothetical protein
MRIRRSPGPGASPLPGLNNTCTEHTPTALTLISLGDDR